MSIELCSGTNTEFYVPDHGSQAAIMAKFIAFKLNPAFFQTPLEIFWSFSLMPVKIVNRIVKCRKDDGKQITFALFRTHINVPDCI